MSNYLAHLVSRSLGVTDSVKPRLPSLFEPLPETMGLSSALAGEENVSTIASTWETTELSASTPQVAQAQELPPQAQTQQRFSLPPSLTQASSSQSVTSPKAQPHLIQESPQLQAQPLLSPLNPAPDDSSTNLPQPRVVQPQVESTISAPHSIEQRVESTIFTPQSTATPIPQAEVSAAREIGSARPEQGSIPTVPITAPVMSSALASVPIEAAPPLRPAMSPEPVQETPILRPAAVTSSPESSVSPSIRSLPTEPIARSQPAPSAPTIHVTIGRIEVRATSPPPTQAKPRPASPVMNLDEYLRQRGGGK